jgi:hypothetical protein
MTMSKGQQRWDGYGKKTSLGTRGKEQGDHREVSGEGFQLGDV